MSDPVDVPAVRPEPRYEIVNGWIVENVGEHTCGTARGGYYGAHEPGCGQEPICKVEDALAAEARVAAQQAENERLTDPYELRERGVRLLGDEQCCELACDGGACESCPCCCAGWCVNGRSGEIPTRDLTPQSDYRIWLDMAKNHNSTAKLLAELEGAAGVEYDEPVPASEVVQLQAALDRVEAECDEQDAAWGSMPDSRSYATGRIRRAAAVPPAQWKHRCGECRSVPQCDKASVCLGRSVPPAQDGERAE